MIQHNNDELIIMFHHSKLSMRCVITSLCKQGQKTTLCYPRHNYSIAHTHYDVLGVSKKATNTQLKAAFVEKSKKLHPDKNPNNPESNHDKFVQLNHSYSTLINTNTRKEYDDSLSYRQRRQHTATNPWSDLQHTYKKEDNDDEYWYDTKYAEHVGRSGAKVETKSAYYIAWGCVAFMLVGILFHFFAFKISRGYHLKQVDARNRKNAELLIKSKANAYYRYSPAILGSQPKEQRDK